MNEAQTCFHFLAEDCTVGIYLMTAVPLSPVTDPAFVCFVYTVVQGKYIKHNEMTETNNSNSCAELNKGI